MPPNRYVIETPDKNFLLTIISVGVMLRVTATYWINLTDFTRFILTGFLERDWILITGFRCTLSTHALRVKVHDRPIRYFYGETCHNFSLNERA